MKLNDPIDIMFDCCLPDRKKLLGALRLLPPGETLRVKVVNTHAVKLMVERFLKNQWCRIVETVDEDETSILRITKEA